MTSDKILTSTQCKAARAALDWSQDDLATKANIARATVADFERGSRMPVKNNLLAIERAFQEAGVKFTNDGKGQVGVRWAV